MREHREEERQKRAETKEKRLSRVGDSTLGIEVSRDYDDKEKREERREQREERREKTEERPKEAARGPQMRPQEVPKEVPRGFWAGGMAQKRVGP